jgi:hypothetical protein
MIMLSIVQVLRSILQEDSLRRIYFIQTTVTGLCDFISQSILVRINNAYRSFYLFKPSKIHSCWIVWQRNIRVVSIPSILALAYLGHWESTYLHSPTDFNSLPLATWLSSSNRSTSLLTDQLINSYRPSTIILPSLATSMTVHALGMALILFRTCRVFRADKLHDSRKFWSITLFLIESAIVMFTIQLVRFVFTIVPMEPSYLPIFIGIHQMLNVIIRSVFATFYKVEDFHVRQTSRVVTFP